VTRDDAGWASIAPDDVINGHVVVTSSMAYAVMTSSSTATTPSYKSPNPRRAASRFERVGP
jgi:hypothetical protein